MPQVKNAAVESMNELTEEETNLLSEDRQSGKQPAADPALEKPAVAAPESQEASEEVDDDEAEGEKPDALVTAEGKERPKTVPHQKFHEERERRKQSDAKLLEEQRRFATLSGRLEVLTQLAQPQAQQAAKVELPDIDKDPVGHFKAENTQLKEQMGRIIQAQQQQSQQTQEQTNIARVAQITTAHEQQFAKENPDYFDAAEFLRAGRDAELQVMGYADPAMRQQILANDVVMIAAQALSNNQSPALTFYNIAKSRGYAKKVEKQNGKATNEQNQLANATQQVQQLSAAQKLANVAAGQKANQSLSSAPGTANAQLTAESLLNMSDDEFAELTKGKNWKKVIENTPRR